METKELEEKFNYKVKVIPLNPERKEPSEYFFLKKPSTRNIFNTIKDVMNRMKSKQ